MTRRDAQSESSPLPSPVTGIPTAGRRAAVRATLLSGVSMLALAGAMLPRAALAQDQVISGPSPTPGPINANGGAITVNGTGSIGGASTGIAAGSITALSNQGTISGSNYGINAGGAIGSASNAGGGTISGGPAAVFNTGGFGTLSNDGLISGNTAGITNASGTIGTLSNTGTVTGLYVGLSNLGSIGALTNAGTISATTNSYFSAPQVGVNNTIGAVIGTLTNSGRIAGLLTGIANSGSIGTLSNFGALISTSTGAIGTFYGLANAATGTIGRLSNSGTIASLNYGVFNLGSIARLTNKAGGTISGPSGGIVNGTTGHPGASIGVLTNRGTISGFVSGVSNLGSIGILDNRRTGLIASSRTAVNNASTIGVLINSGRISGQSPGVFNAVSGLIGTLSNSGTISSSSGTSLNNQGTIGTLTNSGTITGHYAGIMNSGATGTLTNSNAITGTNFAISSTGGGFGPIVNNGRIAGNLSIAGQNVTISGGSGASFGILTGGTITVGDGNLVFAGGNTHLDDDISVDGSVGNAGVLQVAISHLITGSFVQTTAGVLDIQASGTGTGAYGNLTATGAAVLAGGLAFDLVSGFTLAAGDDFDILNFASASGDFSSFSFDGLTCSAGGGDSWTCGGWTFTETLTDTALSIEVQSAEAVPEPATLGLFGSALAALGLLRRRKNRS